MADVAHAPAAPEVTGWGATQRTDNWWLGPLLTFLGLGAFVVYSTFRAILNKDYEVGPLLSPFYSPHLGHWGLGLPDWLSPAFLILWAPGGFRFTCYYYRKAYYRAFVQHPTACAVGEPHTGYSGESAFPLILQNLHRYFMYLAVLFLVFLWHDVWKATRWPVAGGASEFHVSMGTLVLLVNTSLLSGYTFGCHSLRHLIGGKIDCYSCVAFGDARQDLWRGATWFNVNHMQWAWCSLFGVGFADFYVWMVASGRWTDFRIV
ncbi:succinate dehydrogenase [bacterium]|nr:succinate dehydrogenase [bacterium]